ncbi:2Fe-2S iron-sulfur cluster-binding protein [Clostridium grantii]|uniref:2Fe-2S iron-sulfur cluster binding domain-containing protein n=1 Tax=Clostridium grantii DSM 8605 TaxID=1121316 RepID=A0A1M5UXX8_9CLOT|nr:2Fe-2S iron-sulfur cluster-binding protein [Clostridium grantii]SHH67800.1 2Fe-2S iron-sulfur cluster binding domain-containing protein [Clostridium grantii DSM 8605]
MSNLVKFVKEVESKKGKTILSVAEESKVKIKDSCGGKGKCGKCLVKVLEGKVSEPTKAEKKIIGDKKLEKGYRLACECQIDGDVSIEVVK